MNNYNNNNNIRMKKFTFQNNKAIHDQYLISQYQYQKKNNAYI